MQKEDKIKKLVEETLDVAKNIQPVEVNPFLFSKIKNRIEHENEAPIKIQPIYVPVLRAAAVTILFAVNIFILANNRSVSTQENQISSNSIDLIMENYNLNVEENSIYN